MKITTFNPMILTRKPEEAIALFEALGFERRHHKIGEAGDGEHGLDFSTVRMKDANGFHVDVVTADTERLERDLTVIRMNVDDFDEAAELLRSHGFRESLSNTSEKMKVALPAGRKGRNEGRATVKLPGGGGAFSVRRGWTSISTCDPFNPPGGRRPVRKRKTA